MTARRSLFWLIGATSGVAAVQCSPPADTVLDCSASEIRHILHIRASDREVDDLAVVPAKHGDAVIADAEYVLRFQEPRDHYELVFRINRASGRGTRELFDDEQQAVRGHGGFDEISCTPYSGRP